MGFYDNEIKRLCGKCPRLLIMSINSIFDKNHSLSAKVKYLDKEQNDNDNPTFMDMLIQIEDSKYHIEFQLLEGNMAIRMYEYAVKETITELHREPGENSDSVDISDKYEINVVMPEQTVIFLAGNNSRNKIRVNLTLPDRRTVSYELPCISASQTVESLCEKGLYLFLPFQQVQLNSRMNNISNSSKKVKERIAKQLYDYQKNVRMTLSRLLEEKKLTQHEYSNLLECFSNIQQYLLEKDKVVETEVISMGDNNYVAWSDRLRAEGHEAGLEDGAAIKEITLICKKLKKAKDITQIADELESDVEHITEICEVAKKFAPDYDVEAIYAELFDKKSSS